MKTGLEAQVWIRQTSSGKRGGILGKDTSKPISFRTVQKNKKLADFAAEECPITDMEEQHQTD